MKSYSKTIIEQVLLTEMCYLFFPLKKLHIIVRKVKRKNGCFMLITWTQVSKVVSIFITLEYRISVSPGQFIWQMLRYNPCKFEFELHSNCIRIVLFVV